ncbi:hypothetical protein LCGC14_1168720 [marine sediment metagenome]|uniref:Uncharacterized protein n=1 Tax=marine sediment metagenome TaxID=412755 RepID=A0A0F9PW06_9ZZZZ
MSLEIRERILSQEVRMVVPIAKVWQEYDFDALNPEAEPDAPFAEIKAAPAVRLVLTYLEEHELTLLSLTIQEGGVSPGHDYAAYVIIADVMPIDEAPW